MALTLEEAVWKDSRRMSGEVCFRNTRIPIRLFFGYLAAGSLDEFYDEYPDVSRAQGDALLQAAERLIDVPMEERVAS
jgi:uncharacterized protein (DUF433 family)